MSADEAAAIVSPMYIRTGDTISSYICDRITLCISDTAH